MTKCQRVSVSKSLGVPLFIAVCLFMSAGAHAWRAEVLLEPDRLFVQPGEQIEIAVKARITVDAADGSEPDNGSRPTGEQVVGISTYRVPMKLEGLYYVGHQTTTMTQLVPTGNNLVLSYSYINTSITFTADQAEFNCPGSTSTVTCDLGPFATIVLRVDESLELGDTATLTVVAGAAENGVRIQSVRGGYPSNSISTPGNEVTVQGGYIDGLQLEFVVGVDLDINGDGNITGSADYAILYFWANNRQTYADDITDGIAMSEAINEALAQPISLGLLVEGVNLASGLEKLLAVLPPDASAGDARYDALDFNGDGSLRATSDYAILFFWANNRQTYADDITDGIAMSEAINEALAQPIGLGLLVDGVNLASAVEKLLRILPP